MVLGCSQHPLFMHQKNDLLLFIIKMNDENIKKKEKTLTFTHVSIPALKNLYKFTINVFGQFILLK